MEEFYVSRMDNCFSIRENIVSPISRIISRKFTPDLTVSLYTRFIRNWIRFTIDVANYRNTMHARGGHRCCTIIEATCRETKRVDGNISLCFAFSILIRLTSHGFQDTIESPEINSESFLRE